VEQCPVAGDFWRQTQTSLNGKFEVLRIRQDHNFMYNVPKYRAGEYELEPWFAVMPEDMRTAVKEYLGWHLLVKARKI